jgi:CRP-like cAMP-binding protein
MFHLTQEETNFSTESRQILEGLYREQTSVTLKKGRFIRMEAEDIFIVYRGLVQLNTLSLNGDEQIRPVGKPSMPFGLPLTQLNAYEAVTLTDVLLARIDQRKIDQSPLLAQSLLREMTRRLRQTEALLAIAGENRIEDRLKSLLQFLCKEIGQQTEQGVGLSVRLSHKQIAQMIGTTRESITRLLGEFRKEGWVSFDRRQNLMIQPSLGL